MLDLFAASSYSVQCAVQVDATTPISNRAYTPLLVYTSDSGNELGTPTFCQNIGPAKTIPTGLVALSLPCSLIVVHIVASWQVADNIHMYMYTNVYYTIILLLYFNLCP